MTRRSKPRETHLWVLARVIGCFLFAMVFVVHDLVFPNRCWTCLGTGGLERTDSLGITRHIPCPSCRPSEQGP